VQNRNPRRTDVDVPCPPAAPVSNLADSGRAGNGGSPAGQAASRSVMEKSGETHADPPAALGRPEGWGTLETFLKRRQAMLARILYEAKCYWLHA